MYLVDAYEFPFDKRRIVIKTEDLTEREDSRFGTSVGVEIASDIDAAFRFTKLNVLIRDENSSIPTDALRDVYESDVIRATNRFIDSYRFVTGRHAIANLHNLSSVRQLSITRFDDEGQVGNFVINFGAAGAVLRVHQPPLSEETHSQISAKFVNGVPLEDQLMMDAARYATIGHSIQALISAITALDVVVREYPKSRPRWFMRLWHRNSVLEQLVKTSLSNVSDNLDISVVVGAIRERHKVVHAGRRNLKGDIMKYIKNIEAAVQLLRQPK